MENSILMLVTVNSGIIVMLFLTVKYYSFFDCNPPYPCESPVPLTWWSHFSIVMHGSYFSFLGTCDKMHFSFLSLGFILIKFSYSWHCLQAVNFISSKRRKCFFGGSSATWTNFISYFMDCREHFERPASWEGSIDSGFNFPCSFLFFSVGSLACFRLSWIWGSCNFKTGVYFPCWMSIYGNCLYLSLTLTLCQINVSFQCRTCEPANVVCPENYYWYPGNVVYLSLFSILLFLPKEFYFLNKPWQE